MSEAIAISKAVASRLTAASHAGQIGGFSFVAEHSLMPLTTQEATASLVAQIRPRGEFRTWLTRSKTQHDYPIEIILRRKVDKPDSLIAEELLTVAEKIADFWRFLPGSDALDGRNERLVGEVTIAFSDDELREHSIIKETITVTFRGWRT